MKRKNPSAAWQPLTPSGVAAFATAPVWRLLLVQVAMAILAGGVVVWILSAHWSPVISEAVERMPDSAVVLEGRLAGVSSQKLAENRFLSVMVQLDGAPSAGPESDVEIVLRDRDFRLCSILGHFELRYGQRRAVALGRPALMPWWGAWEPVLLAGAGMMVAAGLMVLWALLAAAYMVVARVIGYYADRELSWLGGWKMSGAALMPGALFLTGAMALYGMQWMDVVRLGLFGLGHFVVGWLYLPVALFFVPRISRKFLPKTNPFRPALRIKN